MKTMRIMVALVLIGLIGTTTARAEQVEFNYNGRINVQGQPFDGVGEFKFAIVDRPGQLTYWSSDGTSVAGSEPTSDSIELAVTNGFFSVNIGDIETTGMQPLSPTLFNADDPVFLRVWFNDGVHGFERMNPDRRIVNPALLGQQSSQALTLYVDPINGSDTNNGLTSDTAKQTIQAAWDVLPSSMDGGAMIKLSDGTYRESVIMKGKDVTGDAQIIIKGNVTTPSMVRVTGESLTTDTLSDHGFRLTNQRDVMIEGVYFDSYSRSCIRLEAESTAEIQDCVFKDYTLNGIWLSSSKATGRRLEFGPESSPDTINGTPHGIDLSRQSGLTLIDSHIDGMYEGIVAARLSEAQIIDSTIENCYSEAIDMSFMSMLTMSGSNTIKDTPKGVLVGVNSTSTYANQNVTYINVPTPISTTTESAVWN